jgi:hypothetical protein
LSPLTLSTEPTELPSDPTTRQPGSIWSHEQGSAVLALSAPLPGGDENCPTMPRHASKHA